MNATDFETLNLIDPIRRAVRAQNYENPTPIQASAIPPLLEGRDLLGTAQTGSGKTAAFALPILQNLAKNRIRLERKTARCLVLAPTRELAAQIADSFAVYGKYLGLKQAVVYGGVGKKDQVDALSGGLDILVATPGRLLDLEREGNARLGKVEIFVLDEADRMLDMGFIPDVRRIISMLPRRRQSLFFSATLPSDVLDLAQGMLADPVYVSVASEPHTIPKIDQKLLFVDREHKTSLLMRLLEDGSISRALVFTRTKHQANRLAFQLAKSRIRSDSIHGDKSQSAREKALAGFHSGRIRVLVATDIAARGIDVDDISHVINFELPNEPQSYVHRIGRTARAGKAGTALSFCDASEGGYLLEIEKLLRRSVPVVMDHPYHSVNAASAKRVVPVLTGGRRTPTGGMFYGKSARGSRFGGRRTFSRGRR
jgi:ATP-dependent RNA helicase RhlE